MISHSDYIAITKFARELKDDFVIVERTRSSTDKIINITNQYVKDKIDLALEKVTFEFEQSAEVEYQTYLKDKI